MIINLRKRIRSIALTILAPSFGFFLLFIAEIALKVEVSKLLSSLVNLILVALIALIIFPRVLGIPFGRIKTSLFLQRIGLSYPKNGWKHLLLGIVLAAFTLTGMLIASILSGKYQMNLNRITIPQLVFSLNPGIWEELFYRGVLMILLLQYTRSLKKSFLIQISLFALLHIKGLDAWSLIDALTVGVIAFGFTYTAYKTHALLAGIIFHYCHDALLFFVQVPGDVPLNDIENLIFFGILWLTVFLGCIITKLAAEKFDVRAFEPLYVKENIKEQKGTTLRVNEPEELPIET